MRAISFALTVGPLLAGEKTETRRLGWLSARVGQRVIACRKAMGLKKGEKRQDLAVIEFTAVGREPLNAITPEAVVAEGFPDMTPAEFVDMFCRHMKCQPDCTVTVLQFRVVEWLTPREVTNT